MIRGIYTPQKDRQDQTLKYVLSIKDFLLIEGISILLKTKGIFARATVFFLTRLTHFIKAQLNLL